VASASHQNPPTPPIDGARLVGRLRFRETVAGVPHFDVLPEECPTWACVESHRGERPPARRGYASLFRQMNEAEPGPSSGSRDNVTTSATGSIRTSSKGTVR